MHTPHFAIALVDPITHGVFIRRVAQTCRPLACLRPSLYSQRGAYITTKLVVTYAPPAGCAAVSRLARVGIPPEANQRALEESLLLTTLILDK